MFETAQTHRPPGSPGPNVDSGPPLDRPWHAMTPDEVTLLLESGVEGLDADEAMRRLQIVGPNRLPAKPRTSLWARLQSQFHNLLIHALIAAAVLSFFFGHWVDAAVIIAVVLLNAAIGFVQEGRAQEALTAIAQMIEGRASIIRGGHRMSVAADAIVPGDRVVLQAGDRVPADLRLLQTSNLRIEEAALTGESVAADKGIDPVREDAPLGDRSSMAFSGTLVAAGHGLGVAVTTGSRTEVGRISTLLDSVPTLKTPLIAQMDGFARQLTLIILGASVLAFLFAIGVRDYTVEDAFMIVIGLAVAAIPEGLPAILTITLAIGVKRMAARHAIIRRLPAVETLGAVAVICSDKTGTLTRNEMTARSAVTADNAVEISGGGYEPTGGFHRGEGRVPVGDTPSLVELGRAALLCNDAVLRETDEGWQVDGDPMEGALLALAMKAGFDDAEHDAYRRIDEIPFDAAHRFMATLHAAPCGERLVVIKGAPEQLLHMCRQERRPGADAPLRNEFWHGEIDRLARHGQRVLGFATKWLEAETQRLNFTDLEQDVVFLGLVGLIDPPREDAITAIAACRTAGIRVMMITGDHAGTAREIARQLGLSEQPVVLTGSDVEALDDGALRKAASGTHVFARTTPEHKLRLVKALQAERLVVAMTGDGVNDAPALRRADIGIAMGKGGTEAAKEAAEMVLADDNFASIVAAIREGRTVYDNIMKVISWTLPTNGGEALTILTAIALGLVLPITALQILWINMITAVTLGLTLAFEPTEPGAMSQPPRAAHQPILSGDLLWRIVFVSLLFVVGAFGMYFWAMQRGLGIDTARTMVTNTLVVMEVFYLFSVRYVHGSSLTIRGVLGTKAVLVGLGAVVIGQLTFTYLPFMQRLFHSRPIGLEEGAAIIAVGVALLLVVEGEKLLRWMIATVFPDLQPRAC